MAQSKGGTKLGRPYKRISPQGYQKLAVYPKTHGRIKLNAKHKGLTIVDYLEQLVP